MCVCSSVLKLVEGDFAARWPWAPGASELRIVNSDLSAHALVVLVLGSSGTSVCLLSCACYPAAASTIRGMYMHGVPSLTSCNLVSAAVEQRQTTAHRQTRGQPSRLCYGKKNPISRPQSALGPDTLSTPVL
jgi:hypothetical protein